MKHRLAIYLLMILTSFILIGYATVFGDYKNMLVIKEGVPESA